MKKIILCLISIYTFALADFNRTSAGVVVDTITGLEWQDSYPSSSAGWTRSNWRGAISYCNNLTLDGGGWRLPNINELKSLYRNLDYLNLNYRDIFQNIRTGGNYAYWSSTTAIYFKDYYGLKYTDYAYANTIVGRKDWSYYIRCVRGGS